MSIPACCAPPLAPPDPRTRRAAAAEIIAFDNVIVVYKFIGDLHFYATADAEENEVKLGGFFVRGRFKVVRKENNTRRARDAWEEFRPA